MFAQSVIEELLSYVYLLRDPRSGFVFYVGKGKANRVFDHVACALTETFESDKLDTIREIAASGKVVEHFILRHGLTEAAAFEVEAAVIDFIGIKNLSNQQSGFRSSDFGLKTTDEVIAMYMAPEFSTRLPVLLININKLFNREMTAEEIYEATRKEWIIGPRREKAKYAVATYPGLTRSVFAIKCWEPIGARWSFVGTPATADVLSELGFKSIRHLSKRGAANPIRYINC
jgi:hypothetical protein